MFKFIRFLSGFLAGAAIGAVAAILFTPASGDELRFRFQERISQLQDGVKSAAAERRMELEEQLAALRAPKSGS
jgi:gas vesicle protein